jgi:hypothetical protein
MRVVDRPVACFVPNSLPDTRPMFCVARLPSTIGISYWEHRSRPLDANLRVLKAAIGFMLQADRSKALGSVSPEHGADCLPASILG